MSTNRIRYRNLYILHTLVAHICTVHYVYVCALFLHTVFLTCVCVYCCVPTNIPIHLFTHIVHYFSLKDGFRAIDVATFQGHKEVVEVLLQSGAQVHLQHVDMRIKK